ncbi:MAG: response regulator transcription factor [Deltaproteobacteria bacterium]|nr:response regulator transcription factor [Deltaproteobacteria bacterium]
MATRVILVDDHLIVSQGLKSVLQAEQFDVVGEAANGYEAVKLAQKVLPDVAVLDLSMPMLNGIDAAREIVKVSPETKTMLLTMHTEDHYILEALRAGIRGYILKSHAVTDLIQGIREVFRGGIYLSPGISRAVVDAYLSRTELPPEVLTPRERQVLQLIAEGKSTKEVAVLLGVSTKTAESHRTRIMSKLDIHETATLVRYAIRLGLVQA